MHNHTFYGYLECVHAVPLWIPIIAPKSILTLVCFKYPFSGETPILINLEVA